VSRALIQELEPRFVARGIHRLNAMIRRGNVASMGLSSSLGYEHEETVTVWVKTLPP
jgi:L-amino acid N-acyltransferase YncA